MFLGMELVLPIFIGQIPEIGRMLLPMHIPVLLCGLICGWQYGLVVGFLLPLLRGMTFGMPVLFPSGITMAFELATYGVVVGWLYSHAKWKCLVSLYHSLIPAMVAGRIVWGVVSMVLLGISGQGFTWQMFIGGALITAIPGIILQLVLIPSIMVALNKTGVVPFYRYNPKKIEVKAEKA